MCACVFSYILIYFQYAFLKYMLFTQLFYKIVFFIEIILSNNVASQVHLSSEESEESQKEEEENNLETNFTSCDKSSRIKETVHKSQKKINQAKELSNLTSSQLEAIIGVSLSP